MFDVTRWTQFAGLEAARNLTPHSKQKTVPWVCTWLQDEAVYIGDEAVYIGVLNMWRALGPILDNLANKTHANFPSRQ
jgi:hypothetical protein